MMHGKSFEYCSAQQNCDDAVVGGDEDVDDDEHCFQSSASFISVFP